MRTSTGIVVLLALTLAVAGQQTQLPKDIDAESCLGYLWSSGTALTKTGSAFTTTSPAFVAQAPKTGPGGVSMHNMEAAEPIQMLNQVLRRAVIGTKYFEISALVAAREFDQQYEWSGHEPNALKAGVDQAVIDAIKYNRDVKGLDEKAATIILMGRQLFRGNHQLSPELWAKAVQLFGRQGALDIPTIIGEHRWPQSC